MGFQVSEDRRRNRDGTGFVVFGLRVELHPIDLDDCVLNLKPATSEVDVVNSQTGCLTPPEPAIGEHLHEEAVVVSFTPVHPFAERIDRVSKISYFVVSQIPLGRLADLREVQPMGRVGWKPSVLHRHLETAREHVDNLAHARGRLRLERPPAHAWTAP